MQHEKIKNLPGRYEGKSKFQTFTTELYKQRKRKTKKEHIRLVIFSIGTDVVGKTDDEVYVLSIIKIYSFHLVSLLAVSFTHC